MQKALKETNSNSELTKLQEENKVKEAQLMMLNQTLKDYEGKLQKLLADHEVHVQQLEAENKFDEKFETLKKELDEKSLECEIVKKRERESAQVIVCIFLLSSLLFFCIIQK